LAYNLAEEMQLSHRPNDNNKSAGTHFKYQFTNRQIQLPREKMNPKV